MPPQPTRPGADQPRDEQPDPGNNVIPGGCDPAAEARPGAGNVETGDQSPAPSAEEENLAAEPPGDAEHLQENDEEGFLQER